jgi:ubiquinone/menaquinone biosynthesis C-methylase UbiE
MPPLELRKLVGNFEESAFDNPTGARVFESVPGSSDDFVLDFGCGCGRVARQLMQQKEPPRKYLGVDLHRGMIRWCRDNLSARNPDFVFQHQNVRNPGLNPRGRSDQIAFPAADRSVSLLVATSVFTHLVESQAAFYLREVGRVLREGGVAATTFFLFDKSFFPMMQEFQNALYINLNDPTNAVIFDREWLKLAAHQAGLRICRVQAPGLRGFHWHVNMERTHTADAEHVEFPDDNAPVGRHPPPLLSKGAHRLGM